MSQEARTRGERLQIMLTPEELVLIDDFRFKYRMPSRASSVRELLRRGLRPGLSGSHARCTFRRIWGYG